MRRNMEEGKNSPHMLFIQYALTFVELIKSQQLHQWLPGNTTKDDTEYYKGLDFFKTLIQRDYSFQSKPGSRPASLKMLGNSVMSPIQFERYLTQRDAIPLGQTDRRHRLSVSYFIRMITSMPLIPDPDYLRVLFGDEVVTILTKEDLDTMGYCGFPT